MKTPHHQQGVALLTVLTMVVLISVLAASIAMLHHRLLQSSERTFSQSQAFQYVMAAEQMAMAQVAILSVNDAQNKSAMSPSQSVLSAKNMNSANLMPVPLFPVEGGSISMVLKPKGDCLNINELVKEGTVSPGVKQVWINLLNRLGLPRFPLDSLIDWLDSDDNTLPNGAESNYYQSLTPSYSAANSPILYTGDVLRVKDVNPEDWSRIVPSVCAFSQAMPIDVNTASTEVLSTLDANLNLVEVAAWVQQRDTIPLRLNSVEEFWKIPAFAKVSPNNQKLLTPILTTQGQVYQLLTSVKLGDRNRLVETIIMKDNNTPVIVSRKWK